jgi:hypothetical protein
LQLSPHTAQASIQPNIMTEKLFLDYRHPLVYHWYSLIFSDGKLLSW